jgi:ferredoxin
VLPSYPSFHRRGGQSRGDGSGPISGPLYCRPEHAGGRAIAWTELLEKGSLYCGGVGSTRYVLDYDDPSARPFRDVFRRPFAFRFMDAAKALLVGRGFDLSRLHAESFAPARSTPEAGAETGGARFTVEFARAGKRVSGGPALPLLDLAEANDLELGYACRTGNCGECKVRVLRGDVSATTDVGLTPLERAAGFVLACVASPRSDCVLDA